MANYEKIICKRNFKDWNKWKRKNKSPKGNWKLLLEGGVNHTSKQWIDIFCFVCCLPWIDEKAMIAPVGLPSVR